MVRDLNVTSELTNAVVNEPALVPKEFGGMMAALAIKEQGVKQVYCLTGGKKKTHIPKSLIYHRLGGKNFITTFRVFF